VERQLAHDSEIAVREATIDDRDFVDSTARRLTLFGPPPWRTHDEIVGREQRALGEFFDRPPPDAALLVATGAGDQRLGYVYLETHQDYFTGERHGHLSIIAVHEGAEGRGVGGALLRASEQWARSRGFRRLTLNVFEANGRARGVYEHFGYRVETLHYVKILDREGAE
jgi:ribosomal protein S18 acetylase RimI-like enzyme